MTRGKLALIAVILVAITAFFFLDLGRFLTLDFFKSQQAAIDAYFSANPLRTAVVFFVVYVAVTGLSLPGATLMMLVGGAIFGLLWGTVIVSFASSMGATLSAGTGTSADGSRSPAAGEAEQATETASSGRRKRACERMRRVRIVCR